jgi:hypothetical protein
MLPRSKAKSNGYVSHTPPRTSPIRLQASGLLSAFQKGNERVVSEIIKKSKKDGQNGIQLNNQKTPLAPGKYEEFPAM